MKLDGDIAGYLWTLLPKSRTSCTRTKYQGEEYKPVQISNFLHPLVKFPLSYPLLLTIRPSTLQVLLSFPFQPAQTMSSKLQTVNIVKCHKFISLMLDNMSQKGKVRCILLSQLSCGEILTLQGYRWIQLIPSTSFHLQSTHPLYAFLCKAC